MNRLSQCFELKSNLVYGGSESSEAQAASFC